ncbi:unnamed protein product [Debaryomyces tyrocola]|nr:unnamed protein product [Debaryomyces tyrocola]
MSFENRKLEENGGANKVISPRPQKADGAGTHISKSGGRGDMTREKEGKDSRESKSVLRVEPAPNLKSCLMSSSDGSRPQLSQSGGNGGEMRPGAVCVGQHAHASFAEPEDDISPNRHGLLSLNNMGTASASLDENVAHSHMPNTNFNCEAPKCISPPNSTQGQHEYVSPPPMSRMNSLRYSGQNDKKIIESMRQSKTTSPSPISSPNPDIKASETPEQKAKDKLHLLIGITGCISVNKNIFLIIEKLFNMYTPEKLEIQVVLTKAAEWFLSEKLHKFEAMGVKVWFHDDTFKYFLTNKITSNPSKPLVKLTPSLLSQYILSYDLQKWTDVLLIAPLSANTMAKLINGLSDNLLTDLLHTWPIPQINYPQQQQKSTNQQHDNTVLSNNLLAPKPIVTALALTSSMYAHPITKRQLSLLQESYPNMSILKPVEKCVDIDGNISMGGMRSWTEVVDFVLKKLGEPSKNEDEEVDKRENNMRHNLRDSKKDHIKPEKPIESSDKKVSNKELKEHEKLALQNAIKNSSLGVNQFG